MGDLVTAVRGVCEQREGGVVDWKLAYRELSNVIARIKQLVLNRGLSVELYAEPMEYCAIYCHIQWQKRRKEREKLRREKLLRV